MAYFLVQPQNENSNANIEVNLSQTTTRNDRHINVYYLESTNQFQFLDMSSDDDSTNSGTEDSDIEDRYVITPNTEDASEEDQELRRLEEQTLRSPDVWLLSLGFDEFGMSDLDDDDFDWMSSEYDDSTPESWEFWSSSDDDGSLLEEIEQLEKRQERDNWESLSEELNYQLRTYNEGIRMSEVNMSEESKIERDEWIEDSNIFQFDMSVVAWTAELQNRNHKRFSPQYLRILVELARECAIIQLSSNKINKTDYKNCCLPDGNKISRAGAMLLGQEGNVYPDAVSDIAALHLSHLATESAIHDAIIEAMHPSNYYNWIGMNSAEHLQGLRDLFHLVYGRKHEAPLSFREMISLPGPASPKQQFAKSESRVGEGLNPLAAPFQPKFQGHLDT